MTRQCNFFSFDHTDDLLQQVVEHIEKFGTPTTQWCCGVTDDPARKMAEHGANEIGLLHLILDTHAEAVMLQIALCRNYGIKCLPIPDEIGGTSVICFRMNGGRQVWNFSEGSQ